MRRGEAAEQILQPHLAEGDRGRDPIVPVKPRVSSVTSPIRASRTRARPAPRPSPVPRRGQGPAAVWCAATAAPLPRLKLGDVFRGQPVRHPQPPGRTRVEGSGLHRRDEGREPVNQIHGLGTEWRKVIRHHRHFVGNGKVYVPTCQGHRSPAPPRKAPARPAASKGTPTMIDTRTAPMPRCCCASPPGFCSSSTA